MALVCFSPVCFTVCDFKCAFWVNAWSHKWHLYAFSPVCFTVCAFKCAFWVNAWSHKWHLYLCFCGFVLWFSVCSLSPWDRFVPKLQFIKSHLNLTIPSCLFLTCLFRSHLYWVWNKQSSKVHLWKSESFEDLAISPSWTFRMWIFKHERHFDE